MAFRTRSLGVAAVCALALPVTACWPGDQAASNRGTGTSQSPSASAAASQSPTTSPAEGRSGGGHLTKLTLFRAITAAAEKAGTAHVAMRMTLQQHTSLTEHGVLSYATKPQSMRVTVRTSVLDKGLRETIVGGRVYLAIPGMTPPGKFVVIDPRDPHGPFGPMGSLLQSDPMASVKRLGAGVDKVSYAGSRTLHGVSTDEYVVRVNLETALKAMGVKGEQLRQTPGLVPRNHVVYRIWVDARNRMRQVRYDVAGLSTVRMTMSRWGEPVHISAPPKSKTVPVPPGRPPVSG
jgi:hypothetical protein